MNKETNIHKQTIINKNWNATSGKMEFSFTFAFANKEQYLEFRSVWKQHYAELSTTIQGRKALIKTTLRSHEYAGELQRDAHNLAAVATVQLLMRKAAKSESNRQYLLTRQTAK